MSLRRLIADVRGREKTLTVHAPPNADVVDAVREYFDSQNVAIEHEPTGANDRQLHSGFQQLSNVAKERTTYDRLAASDIDVHVYGNPDAEVEDAPFSVHGWDDEELSAMWFVLFDGGGNREQSSALLAEERGHGGFYGFWTYDPDLVDQALSALDAYRQPA